MHGLTTPSNTPKLHSPPCKAPIYPHTVLSCISVSACLPMQVIPSSADLDAETELHSMCIILHGLKLHGWTCSVDTGCCEPTATAGQHLPGVDEDKRSASGTDCFVVASPTCSYADSLVEDSFLCPVFVCGSGDVQDCPTESPSLPSSALLHLSLPLPIPANVAVPWKCPVYLSCHLPV